MNPTIQLWLGAFLVVSAAAMVFYRLVSKRETLAEIDTQVIEHKSENLAKLLTQTDDISDRENLIDKFRGAINEGASKTIDERE